MPRQPSAASRRRQQQQQQHPHPHPPPDPSSSPPLHPAQQIHHLPSEVFHYEPRHRVMICLWCKCAILDAPFKDHLGTRSHKTYRHLTRYDEFRAYLETFPQRVKKTEEIVITPDPIPVVRGLGDPLYPSYQCTFDRCGYVGMGIPQIKEHCTTRHGWTNPQRRGRPSKKRKLEEEGESPEQAAERKRKLEAQLPWVTVASQQFFPRGRGSQRFRVLTPAEAAAAGLPPSAAGQAPDARMDGVGAGAGAGNSGIGTGGAADASAGGNGSGSGAGIVDDSHPNRNVNVNPSLNLPSPDDPAAPHHANAFAYQHHPPLPPLPDFSPTQNMPPRQSQQPHQHQHQQPAGMQHAHPQQQHHQQQHHQQPQPQQQQEQQQQTSVDSLAGVDEETARRLLANA